MSKKQKLPILDHIFGDLDLPENGAPWLLERTTGMHHYNHKQPSHPKPGEEVTLLVTNSDEQSYSEVLLWYSTDGWQTRQQMAFQKSALTWDSLRWGWLQYWEITLPPQTEGTMLRYKIGAQLSGQPPRVFADNQALSFDQATNYSIWYDPHSTPDWAKAAIVYQVFVDRFNPGAGRGWLQTEDLMQPFGGTLRGITEKLSHIRDMGFNALWLMPIFDSPSHHGYDTRDYYKINPRFGTDTDFDALVQQAHDLGLRVILDFVANHCSNQHPAFLDALNHKNSRYHDWFTWHDWPHYQSFYNVKEMPELDLRYAKPARQYLLNCAQHWLKRGVDGFRLDYAHGPEHDFWVDFRRACREVKPDCWTFGEVVQPADIQASFAGGIDGSLDFLMCQALRLTFAQQTWPLSRLAGFLVGHQAYYPEDFSLPAFIDNHDMNRFLFSAHDDVCGLKLALMLLYMLPGPPVIYYGTEMGMTQNRSIHEPGALGFDEARLPMQWQGKPAVNLQGYLKKLADLRLRFHSLVEDTWQLYEVDDHAETMVMHQREGQLWFLINRSDQAKPIKIRTSIPQDLTDMLTGESYYPQAGELMISMEAVAGKVFFRNGAN